MLVEPMAVLQKRRVSLALDPIQDFAYGGVVTDEVDTGPVHNRFQGRFKIRFSMFYDFHKINLYKNSRVDLPAL